MKKFLTATAVLALSAGAAMADKVGKMDEPRVEPIVHEPAAPSHNWTGGYFGLQAGIYEARHRLTFPTIDLMTAPDSSGLHGGLYAGYNWQGGGNMVFGIEGELNAFRGTGDDVLRNMNGVVVNPNENWESRLRSDGAIRLRAGFLAEENTLLYATAGVAAARYRFGVEDAGVPRDEYSDTRTGWTLGVGIEHALANGMNLRVDYRFSDYGTVSYDTELPGTVDTDSRLRTHQVRVGAAFRF